MRSCYVPCHGEGCTGHIGDGASNLLLRHLVRGDISAVATQALFYEYEAVLMRPEQLAATRLTQEEALRIIDALHSAVEGVQVWFRWRPQLIDADDEVVLEAAIIGHADLLTTFNMRDFRGITSSFGIRAVTPFDLIKDMRNG